MHSKEVDTAILITRAIAEAVREATKIQGYAISGHLYAALLHTGITLDYYNAALSTLEKINMIELKRDHTIVWTGPIN